MVCHTKASKMSLITMKYYILRRYNIQIPSVDAVNKSMNSLGYFGAIIGNALPIELRDID